MPNFKRLFIETYEQLKTTPLFQHLKYVKEDSPWHREANVFVHINMVVEEYIKLAPDIWTQFDFCAAMACAFHDIAKPLSHRVKFKPERGVYNAFHGHEQLSARMFEDYCLQTGFLSELNPYCLYAIEFLIENHIPWETKDKHKLRAMALTANRLFGSTVPFTNALMADTKGRISDDGPEKIAKSQAWCDSFNQLGEQYRDVPLGFDTNDRLLLLPIGCSGSGKSSWVKQALSYYMHYSVKVYSLDEIRHRYYDPNDYTAAFKASTLDPTFESKAKQEFMALVKDKNVGCIIVDNTNLTHKTRRFYIQNALAQGVKCAAVLFPVSLQQVIERQTSRTDKTVPIDAVKRQYMSIQLPMFSDDETGVCEVVVIPHNIEIK